jgi:hypothetical protein
MGGEIAPTIKLDGNWGGRAGVEGVASHFVIYGEKTGYLGCLGLTQFRRLV